MANNLQARAHKAEITRHLAFALWASRQPKVPRPRDIVAAFDVTWTTASYWRKALLKLNCPAHPLHRLAATGSAITSQKDTHR